MFGGTSTSAVVAGGGPGTKNETEIWNGTNWTETSNLNTSRYFLGGTGASSTDVLAFGGLTPSPSALTEQWAGSSWTEVADLSTARGAFQGSGNGTSGALAAGGEDAGSSALTATEEWNAKVPTTVTFSDS